MNVHIGTSEQFYKIERVVFGEPPHECLIVVCKGVRGIWKCVPPGHNVTTAVGIDGEKRSTIWK
jgi:hypothetical protein